MKRRATSMLFAVATGGPVAAIAGPTSPTSTPSVVVAPLVEPRVLPSGAPACGNVLWKMSSFPDPLCQRTYETGRQVVAALVEEARGIGRVLAVFDGFPDRSLTVAQARRPGS